MHHDHWQRFFCTEARGCGVAGGWQRWRRRLKLTHLVGNAGAVVLLKIGNVDDDNNNDNDDNDDNDDNNDDKDNNDINNDNNNDNDDDDNNDDNDDNDDDDNNDDNDDDLLLSLPSSPLPTLRRMTAPASPTKRVSFGCPRHHRCPPSMPLPPASVQKNPSSTIVMCTAATHHRCQPLRCRLLPPLPLVSFLGLSLCQGVSGDVGALVAECQNWGIFGASAAACWHGFSCWAAVDRG